MINKCSFCNKEYKNRNATVQHEIRCKLNPNKIDTSKSFNNGVRPTWNKGLTKETSEKVRRASDTLRKTLKEKQHIFVHKEHNDKEIKKWLDYVASLNVTIPTHTIRRSQGYYVLKDNSHLHNKGTHFIYEHKYIMSFVLPLENENTVHHIDGNGLNNKLTNLLVFETMADHKRYHHSDYSYLLYDEKTHKFSTILKK